MIKLSNILFLIIMPIPFAIIMLFITSEISWHLFFIWYLIIIGIVIIITSYIKYFYKDWNYDEPHNNLTKLVKLKNGQYTFGSWTGSVWKISNQFTEYNEILEKEIFSFINKEQVLKYKDLD